jgi:hypothetical protein
MDMSTSGRTTGWRWQRLLVLMGFSALTALAVWARFGPLPRAAALPPTGQTASDKAPAPKPAAAEPSDYAQRSVAVIYGNIFISREEFGEYLISRHSDALELLINKRIIEHACKEKGIEVTAAEITASLAEDLKGMGGLRLDDFVTKVLKRYNKTLFEWKEDVIRPKLLMTKLCKDRVHVTEQDYKSAFTAYYGEKVEARIILFPKEEKNKVINDIYGELRKSDANFERYAKRQASTTLAANGGRIDPIGHNTTGDEALEKMAFSLQPGEVSRVFDTPQGVLVMKCDRRIPADTSKKLDSERPKLEKEILEKKIRAEMPKVFQELREQAHAQAFLNGALTEAQLIRDVKQELTSHPSTGAPAHAQPPHGN